MYKVIRLLKSIVIMGMTIIQIDVANAQVKDLKKLKEALQSRIDHGQSVGMFVGIVEGKRDYYTMLGYMDKESKQEIENNTLFEIGSITKTFTGLLLADMVVKGEVGLHDPIKDYLPDTVKVPTRNGQEITLYHLVTHSSGLPRLPEDFVPADMTNPYADYKAGDMYEFLSGYEITKDIGKKVEYSNFGMGLLGHILSLKGGKPYEDLVKERILTPLEMDDTTITISEKQKQYFATGHGPVGDAVSQWDFNVLEGAGAVRSTGEDMIKYLIANLGDGGGSLQNSIQKSHEMMTVFESDNSQVGFGWIELNEGGESFIFHDGGTGGFRSAMAFNKDRKVGALVLTNSYDDPVAIIRAILTGKEEDLIVTEAEPVQNAQRYIGDYQLSPEFILTVTVKDDQLFIQATGQPSIQVYQEDKNKFFYKVVEASVTFEEDGTGEITGLTLHQGGDHKAPKIK